MSHKHISNEILFASSNHCLKYYFKYKSFFICCDITDIIVDANSLLIPFLFKSVSHLQVSNSKYDNVLEQKISGEEEMD